MSTPPCKHNLDFILNQETEKSGEEDRSHRRTRRHEAGPSSGSSHAGASSSHNRDRTTKQPRSGQPSSSSQLKSHGHSASTQPGSSSDHSRMYEERTFRCKTCSKAFAEKGNLNKHISSVHLKEKTKVCPEPGCGKSFAFRDGLVRHIAHVHKNQRHHVCQLCGNSFKQASHLTKHLRSIHKEQI